MFGKVAYTPEKARTWEATDIGPSALSITIEDDVTIYRCMLWVGGTRFDDEAQGTWGKNITMDFRIPSSQRNLDVRGAVEVAMGKYYQKLAATFGHVSAEAICIAIPAIADGIVIRKSFAPQQIIDGAYL